MHARKVGHVLFNDALDTFYLRLYGVRHSDSERPNPLPPHGLLFPISNKGSLYASSHRHLFLTPIADVFFVLGCL